MTESIHMIALRTTRYSDRHSILSVYTLERGPMSLLLPEGKGRTAVRLRALTMPLSVCDCEVDVRPGRAVYNFHDMRPALSLTSLRSNPFKIAVGHLLAEVLGGILREGQPDRGMYEFVTSSIEALESASPAISADFHLWFLYRLAEVAGIAPDVSTWREGSYFDMLEGIFRPTPPLHSRYLSVADSRIVKIMDNIHWRGMRCLRMNHQQRNRMLDIELEYFTLHYSSLSSLKSIEVLRTLF